MRSKNMNMHRVVFKHIVWMYIAIYWLHLLKRICTRDLPFCPPCAPFSHPFAVPHLARRGVVQAHALRKGCTLAQNVRKLIKNCRGCVFRMNIRWRTDKAAHPHTHVIHTCISHTWQISTVINTQLHHTFVLSLQRYDVILITFFVPKAMCH